MSPGSLAALTLAAAVVASQTAAVGAAEKVRNHFDTDAPMRPPGFFEFAVLGSSSPAEWKVLADYNTPSAPNQVTQTVGKRPEDSVALAIRRNVSLRDGTISVGLRNGSGRGGLALRMSGEADLLLLLVDLSSGDARLSQFTAGKPVELARARVKADRAWSILLVTLTGRKVTARWDDKPLLAATDPRPAAGRAALATTGNGPVAFDELLIEPTDSPQAP